jgi:UDP-MurNAc hydroxylase
MDFKILGHASLYIKSDNYSIVIDPWLLGSCYWRSWWNYPTASYDEIEMANVDAVVISHIHWDHWHGPTLKRLFKGKRIITPDEPGMRSRKDLKAIGFKDIECVPHGKTISVGDIEITLYQFGLFLNDAAIVIRTGGVTILNANDAKIAGWSLEHLIKKHGKIDFAFRSHSSANARINYKIDDQEEDFVADDRNHYFRSFQLFMDAVSPNYAIPFASNHCHLHDETLHFNNYISNPLELREYCKSHSSTVQHWQLKVMLPGSEWNSKSGFNLKSEDPFINKQKNLQYYRERVNDSLIRYRAEENKVKISDILMKKFLNFFTMKPFWHSKYPDFLLTVTWPDLPHKTFKISPGQGTWQETEATLISQPGLGLIVIPAIVFRDSINKNMFHHAGISKRCQFIATSKSDLSKIEAIFGLLERIELGVYPLNAGFIKNLFRAYISRWREIFVYMQAFIFMKIYKKPLYLIEEIILSKTNIRRVKF